MGRVVEKSLTHLMNDVCYDGFMFDHVGFLVADYEKSKAFYSKVLAVLGYSIQMEYGTWGGFGSNGKPSFWIGSGRPSFWTDAHKPSASPVHIAFKAKDRAQVDAFYEAAIAAGAKDNGKPGLRPEYHANYYGAFVLDPDGNNIEACVHG